MSMTGNGFLPFARVAFLAAALSLPLSSAFAEERPIVSKSTVDWGLQRVDSTLTLDTAKSGITLPTDRSAALQLIEMETPALLKNAFFSVLVDSSSRVGDTVDRGELSMGALNALLDAGKTTPPAFSTDLKRVSMTHAVGLHDLAALYLRDSGHYVPKPPLETAPTRAFTGILVDARGALPVHGEYASARLEPCLFPKLWSEGMDRLYDRDMVQAAIAKARGIVTYSASPDEGEYRRIVGNDPLRIVARGIYGINRTDPIVSREDYLKIVSLEANRKLLSEGKIVILCDAEALKAREAVPARDADRWFVRGEIAAALERKPIKDVELSEGSAGLTLTAYDIRFEADTARILPSERARLDAIAEALKEAGNAARFTVEGHTASVGKPSGELALSVERARVIADELARRGIPRENIGHSGYGGSRPVAGNDTDEGRARNRRVEIVIAP